jgi:hypothetical protein
MKARTVLKWAIGVIAFLAVVALAGVVWLFIAFFLDMEKGADVLIIIYFEKNELFYRENEESDHFTIEVVRPLA